VILNQFLSKSVIDDDANSISHSPIYNLESFRIRGECVSARVRFEIEFGHIFFEPRSRAADSVRVLLLESAPQTRSTPTATKSRPSRALAGAARV
jgi:hypothetical protein